MHEPSAANWGFPTAIRFGVGRVAELADACVAANISRPLLVTDRGLATTDLVTQAARRCTEAGLPVHVFAQVDSNPTEENIATGITAYRDCGADGVIAFGGGSGLDAGKLIAFAQGQSRPLWDFEDVSDFWTRANADAIAPVVAVPTTAGTGSEVGRAGVVT
ncbi:MAG: iron-containing alcohol dehydrogenase, partial [Gammaproteobacteria bacterium]|nr:iron-containing alcohol dehydrogenase [Gammaproteobacteria bacterium]